MGGFWGRNNGKETESEEGEGGDDGMRCGPVRTESDKRKMCEGPSSQPLNTDSGYSWNFATIPGLNARRLDRTGSVYAEVLRLTLTDTSINGKHQQRTSTALINE